MTALRKPSIYAGLDEFQYDFGDSVFDVMCEAYIKKKRST